MWTSKLARNVSGISSNLGLYLQKRDLSTRVFISRLSFYTTRDQLYETFSRFGRVEEARLVMDAERRRPKGFAFVTYSSEAEAQEAVKSMNGRIYGGRLIFVEVAKPEPEEGTSDARSE